MPLAAFPVGGRISTPHQRDNAEWSAGLLSGLYGALSRTRRTGGRRSGGGVWQPGSGQPYGLLWRLQRFEQLANIQFSAW
jgi:hypothetical protein